MKKPSYFNMKKKKLYLPNGYLNMGYLIEEGNPFVTCIGGRGIGKTYGAFEYLIEHGLRFLYIRRTQTQVDTVTSDDYNPLKPINADKNWRYMAFSIPKTDTYTIAEEYINDRGRSEPAEGTSVGIAGALSTFANLRGFSGEDIDVIFYDEFIKEKHQADMKGEAEAFFNLCETVIRNRELKGKPPCKVLMFSNSTDAANPLFLELGIVSTVMKMQKSGQDFMDIPERALTVVLPHDSPVSDAKKETALYKFTRGTTFERSSLENEFVNNQPTSVISRRLLEYKPIVHVGEICIYKHKSERKYYVSEHVGGSPETYNSSEKELAIFRRRYKRIMLAVYEDRIDYENYTCELLFDKYFQACYY